MIIVATRKCGQFWRAFEVEIAKQKSTEFAPCDAVYCHQPAVRLHWCCQFRRILFRECRHWILSSG